jgi:hypothetical protein
VQEAFRDDDGNPTDHPGLRLRPSDFACEELAPNEMEDNDTDVSISSITLSIDRIASIHAHDCRCGCFGAVEMLQGVLDRED